MAPPHGETLPITNRTLNFRLTARDNRANGGGVNTADMAVTVIENGTGFAVTAPTPPARSLTAQTSASRGTLTLTNLPPVNAPM